MIIALSRLDSLLERDPLEDANKKLHSAFISLDVINKKYPGIKMGNIAIKSSWLHLVVWEELVSCGLVKFLYEAYPKYRYVSFGGNVNMPGSKRQRLHIDTTHDTLIINVPLSDVAIESGPLSVRPSRFPMPVRTRDIFFGGALMSEQSLVSKIGDVFLRHSSLWHRGNPNSSAYLDLCFRSH